jgi:hypothetical protein
VLEFDALSVIMEMPAAHQKGSLESHHAASFALAPAKPLLDPRCFQPTRCPLGEH